MSGLRKIVWISSVLVGSISTLACGSDPKPAPTVPASTAPAPPPAVVQSPKPEDDGNSGQLNISDEIRKACGITDTKASFGFDSATIQSGNQPVLNKLAECFTTGPLKGRSMRLVGHADPRGEPEYNMVLGGRRADNVKSYLVRKGIKDAQAETTSRGEMDAMGTEEASWATDRRVDVVLASN